MNFKKTLSMGILSALLCSSPAFAMIQNTSKRCWTEEENNALLAAHKDYNGKWNEIINLFPNRTLSACQHQFYRINPDPPPTTHIIKWEPEEKGALLAAHNDCNGKWNEIINLFPNRTLYSCKHQFYKINPDPPPTTHIIKWEPEEKGALLAAYNDCNGNWNEIIKKFPNRTLIACQHQFYKIKPAHIKWTLEENQKLINAYKTHGENWEAIAEQFPERTKKQCRIHFYDIEPAYKVKWEPDEDKTLIYLNNLIGNKWDCISKSLPGRTPMRCKRRFLKLKTLKSAFKETLEDSEAISENSENRLSGLLPPDFSIEALLNSH